MMDGSSADDPALAPYTNAKTKGGGGGGFLSKSIRALQRTASSSSLSSPSRKPAHTDDSTTTTTTAAVAGGGQHRRQPTGDSLAVQICPDDGAEEIYYTSADADAARILPSDLLLFAPRHRRTITPMGGGAKVVVGSGTGTCSSETANSSMQVLRSSAATTAASSSSGSSSGGSKISKFNKKKKKNQKKEPTKMMFAMDDTQPLPRLGNDPNKNSVRNISTEVLADEGQESQNDGCEDTAKAERSGYYDSLTLTRNDFASTSYFGGVLARDDRAGEFRSTAAAAAGESKASFFRAVHRGRSSRAVGQHCSDVDIGTKRTLPFPNRDDHSIRQAGSFDTLVSRSLLSADDDNLTHRSFVTTGSIETVWHCNKNKAKRERVGNGNVESRAIAGRVKPIDEDDDKIPNTDSDQDNDEDNNGSSSKRIPKVLRQTGTIIKRALRDVTSNSSKGGTMKASRGSRLGSEAGIQWDLHDNGDSGSGSGGAFASSRARIQSADVYYAHQLHDDAKEVEVLWTAVVDGRRISI